MLSLSNNDTASNYFGIFENQKRKHFLVFDGFTAFEQFSSCAQAIATGRLPKKKHLQSVSENVGTHKETFPTQLNHLKLKNFPF